MSIDTFESILKEREIDAAIAEAEAEYTSDDQLIDVREAFSSLRRKYLVKLTYVLH